MDISLLTRLIANLLQVGVLTFRDEAAESEETAETLRAFEEANCFSPALQPLFTAEGLRLMLADVKPNIFYETESRLHVSLLLFRTEDTVFLVGPYAKDIYRNRPVQEAFAEKHLNYSMVYAFRLYYTALPLLVTETVTHAVMGILHAVDPETPDYTLRLLQDFTGESTPAGRMPEEAKLQDVYQRYRFENAFLSAIRNGETDTALRMFDRMSGNYYERYRELLTTEIYRDPRVSNAILRALIRKAAEEGGLSVITIDTVTQRQAQLSGRAGTRQEQAGYLRQMIRDLTDGVRASKLRSEGCSPETKQILEYLQFHYAEPVTIEALCGRTGYSRAHISARFKEDTGRTILQYLAELRCGKAADLLTHTSLPVADISATVGYPDGNYFVKVFKKQMGKTPSEWRREK